MFTYRSFSINGRLIVDARCVEYGETSKRGEQVESVSSDRANNFTKALCTGQRDEPATEIVIAVSCRNSCQLSGYRGQYAAQTRHSSVFVVAMETTVTSPCRPSVRTHHFISRGRYGNSPINVTNPPPVRTSNTRYMVKACYSSSQHWPISTVTGATLVISIGAFLWL